MFLADYKTILKIAGGVKQLTIPLLPDPNCSMPENDAQCVIPVNVYKIIKQLFHGPTNEKKVKICRTFMDSSYI